MTNPGPRRLALAAVVGYGAGLIPSADLAARLASGGQVDLRRHGSGNPGAANAAKVLGSKWGLAVMTADIAKSAVAARVGRRLAGTSGQQVASVASVVGHCYPVTNAFRGGKGVGCSVGQCLATFPAYLPIDVALATAVATGPWKKRAMTATTVSSLLWVAGAALWWRRQWPNWWGGTPTVALPVGAAASSVVILHRFWAGRDGLVGNLHSSHPSPPNRVC